MLLSVASGQKLSAKREPDSVTLKQLNDLIGIKSPLSEQKLDNESFSKWLKSNEENKHLMFILNSHVTNYWSMKSSADLIISSISAVCHLSDHELSTLEGRFHQLSCYNDYIKCDDITDNLAKYVPYDIANGFVTWFDVNEDNRIDLKEFCCSISSVARGPEPERFKHIYQLLKHTKDVSVNYASLGNVIADIVKNTSEPDIIQMNQTWQSEIDFMTKAISASGETIFFSLLHFYSDICHLLFGLHCVTENDEFHLIKRWEAKHDEHISENTKIPQFKWLIDIKWWKKWEKRTDRNERKRDETTNELNEVILSLKNLGKDDDPQKLGRIDNSSLFKSSNNKFVFEERGHIPKIELGFSNCKPVSEFTFNYLKSKYGPCTGKSYHPY